MDESELEQIQQQCVFCQIALGAVPAKKIFEDEKVIGVLDINPANAGHVLLLPKKHYAIMPQIPEDEIGHIGMVAKGISHAMIKSLEAKGTTIFIANGGAAGQRAMHFMMHVIPRNDKDDVGIMIPAREMKKEDLAKVKQVVKSAVNRQFGIKEEIKEDEITQEKAEEGEKKEETKEPEKIESIEKKKKSDKQKKPTSLDDISDFLARKK